MRLSCPTNVETATGTYEASAVDGDDCAGCGCPKFEHGAAPLNSDDAEFGMREHRCPTCDSPQPHLHPAVQSEGEVQPCRNPWHAPTA